MTRGTIAFAFEAARLALQRQGPTEPRFPPIQFQKESPREKRKSMESGNGARADAPSLRGAGRRRDTTRAERTIWERATTRSARAKSVALRLEIGSSGAVYSHEYKIPPDKRGYFVSMMLRVGNRMGSTSYRSCLLCGYISSLRSKSISQSLADARPCVLTP